MTLLCKNDWNVMIFQLIIEVGSHDQISGSSQEIRSVLSDGSCQPSPVEPEWSVRRRHTDTVTLRTATSLLLFLTRQSFLTLADQSGRLCLYSKIQGYIYVTPPGPLQVKLFELCFSPCLMLSASLRLMCVGWASGSLGAGGCCFLLGWQTGRCSL